MVLSLPWVRAAMWAGTSSAAAFPAANGPFAAGKAAAELLPAHIAALTQGRLKTMTLLKAKIAAAVLALAVLGTGISWAAHGARDAAPRPQPGVAPPPADAP